MPPPAPAPEPPSVTAVVVAYKSGPLVIGLAGTIPATIPMVVVDNSPSAGLEAALRAARPGARYIHRPENVGFGVAANLGAATADTEFLAILNPDVGLEADTLGRCAAQLRADPRLGAVGEVRRLRFGRRVVVGRFVSGACLVLRTEAFRAIGGFDEDFFLYYEDTDLSLRLMRAGYRIAQADAQPRHRDGHSVVEGEANHAERRWLMGASARLFRQKHPWSPAGMHAVWYTLRRGREELRRDGDRSMLDGYEQSRGDLPGCLRDCFFTTGRRRATAADA